MKKGIFFTNAFNCKQVNCDLEKMVQMMCDEDIEGLQLDYDEIDEEQTIQLARLIKKYNRKVFCMHWVCRICSTDDMVFSGEIERCRKVFEKAVKLSCKKIMIVPFNISDVEISGKEKATEQMTKGLRMIIALAKKYEIEIYLENISQKILPFSSVDDIKYFMKNIADLHFAFDTGNFVCIKQGTVEAYMQLSEYIELVHVKDFDIVESNGLVCDSGLTVRHIAFGFGKAQLRDVLKNIYCSNPLAEYIIEIHSRDVEKEVIHQTVDFLNQIEQEENL